MLLVHDVVAAKFMLGPAVFALLEGQEHCAPGHELFRVAGPVLVLVPGGTLAALDDPFAGFRYGHVRTTFTK